LYSSDGKAVFSASLFQSSVFIQSILYRVIIHSDSDNSSIVCVVHLIKLHKAAAQTYSYMLSSFKRLWICQLASWQILTLQLYWKPWTVQKNSSCTNIYVFAEERQTVTG